MEGGSRGVRKGAWSEEEDLLLRKCIKKYGEGKWRQVPLKAGLNRCRKSCRLRWLNYLHPNIKRGEFTSDEVDLIIRMHKLLGNRWSLIAGRLPGRTANDIKNYCNSHLKNMLFNRNNKEVTKLSSAQEHKYHQILIKPAANKKGQYENQTSGSKVLRPLPRTFSKNSKWFKATGIPTTTNSTSSVVAAATNETMHDVATSSSFVKFSDSNGQTPLWLKSILQLEADDEDYYQAEMVDGIERSMCVKGNRDEDDYWNDFYLDNNLLRLLGEDQEILV